MGRNEAIRYMTSLGLKKHTAEIKITEATRNPGEPVLVFRNTYFKAVPVQKAGQLWDFVFTEGR
jgi:hypothetical protein